VQAGKIHRHGPELYGYRRDKKAGVRTIYEPEAEVVRQIFRWYVEERLIYETQGTIHLYTSQLGHLITLEVESKRLHQGAEHIRDRLVQHHWVKCHAETAPILDN
jgi:hypothetical protein